MFFSYLFLIEQDRECILDKAMQAQSKKTFIFFQCPVFKHVPGWLQPSHQLMRIGLKAKTGNISNPIEKDNT